MRIVLITPSASSVSEQVPSLVVSAAEHWATWGHVVSVVPVSSFVSGVGAALVAPCPDVVVAPLSFPGALAGWLCGIRFWCPLVLVCDDASVLPDQMPGGVARWASRRLSRTADAVICLSAQARNALIRQRVRAGRIALAAPLSPDAGADGMAGQVLQILEIAAAGYGDRVDTFRESGAVQP